MSPRQPTPENEESQAQDSKHTRPGELKRDEERDDRGIVYHGADWDRADEENERGVVEHSAEEKGESDIEGGGKGGEAANDEDDRDDEDGDDEVRDFDNDETLPGRG